MLADATAGGLGRLTGNDDRLTIQEVSVFAVVVLGVFSGHELNLQLPFSHRLSP